MGPREKNGKRELQPIGKHKNAVFHQNNAYYTYIVNLVQHVLVILYSLIVTHYIFGEDKPTSHIKKKWSEWMIESDS